MKRIETRVGVVTVALLLMLVTTSCVDDEPGTVEGAGSRMIAKLVPVGDEREVWCVVMDGKYSGGIDCDWGHAK